MSLSQDHMPPRLLALVHRVAHLGFTEWGTVDCPRLLQGDPAAFAVLVRHMFSQFPCTILSCIKAHEWFCVEADGTKLMLSVSRLLRERFAYKSSLTAVQIAKSQFFDQKARMVLDLAALLRAEEVRLTSTRGPRCRQTRHPAANAVTQCASDDERGVVDGLHFVESRLAELELKRRQLNRCIRLPATASHPTHEEAAVHDHIAIHSPVNVVVCPQSTHVSTVVRQSSN